MDIDAVRRSYGTGSGNSGPHQQEAGAKASITGPWCRVQDGEEVVQRTPRMKALCGSHRTLTPPVSDPVTCRARCERGGGLPPQAGSFPASQLRNNHSLTCPQDTCRPVRHHREGCLLSSMPCDGQLGWRVPAAPSAGGTQRCCPTWSDTHPSCQKLPHSMTVILQGKLKAGTWTPIKQTESIHQAVILNKSVGWAGGCQGR